MARFSRPVMIRMSVAPDCTASSTTQWIAGRSTTGSISFGCSLVSGRKRVPKPAAGMTTFMVCLSPCETRGSRLHPLRYGLRDDVQDYPGEDAEASQDEEDRHTQRVSDGEGPRLVVGL